MVKTIEEVIVQEVSFALVSGHTGVTIIESGNGSVFSFVHFFHCLPEVLDIG